MRELTIVMERDNVLKILEANRIKHIDEYDKQIAGWQISMKAYNVEMEAWASHGGQGKQPPQPHKPESFVKDYARLMTIISHHIKPDIELTYEEIEKVVFDKWGWSGTFSVNSATYAGR